MLRLRTVLGPVILGATLTVAGCASPPGIGPRPAPRPGTSSPALTPDIAATAPTARGPLVRPRRDLTPAEVAAGSYAIDVARVGGRTLVAWGADSGGEDAGPSVAAWQLFAADGRTVLAEGDGPYRRNGDVARVDVYPVDDGFLVAARRYLHVRLDGAVEQVPLVRGTTRSTRGTEAFVRFAGGFGLVYRDGRLQELDPPAVAWDSVIDGGGGWWGQDVGTFTWTPDGTTTPIDVSRATPEVSGQGYLQVVGERVVLAEVGATGGVERLTAWPQGRPDRPVDVPVDGLATASYFDVSVGQVGSELVVAGFASPWFRGSFDGGWEQVVLPVPDAAFSAIVAGDRLYAVGYYDVGTFVSHDVGRTWQRVTAELVS